MLTAIVPAKNEAGRIYKVLYTLLQLKEIDRILVVLNGSNDHTLAEVKSFKSKKIILLFFKEALGIDIPRAIGAAYAQKIGSTMLLFIDGDMVGEIKQELHEMIKKTYLEKLDLSLSNCYPHLGGEKPPSTQILLFRKLLNKKIGLYEQIQTATPSHGPHLVSLNFLKCVPLKAIAIPPVGMAIACKYNLKIGLAAQIPHFLLGSSLKDKKHSRLIKETIIGDSIEALEVFYDLPRIRTYQGKKFLGYHPERRFDLLQKFSQNIVEAVC